MLVYRPGLQCGAGSRSDLSAGIEAVHVASTAVYSTGNNNLTIYIRFENSNGNNVDRVGAGPHSAADNGQGSQYKWAGARTKNINCQ